MLVTMVINILTGYAGAQGLRFAIQGEVTSVRLLLDALGICALSVRLVKETLGLDQGINSHIYSHVGNCALRLNPHTLLGKCVPCFLQFPSHTHHFEGLPMLIWSPNHYYSSPHNSTIPILPSWVVYSFSPE